MRVALRCVFQSLGVGAAICVASAAQAAPFVLTNGPGDGTVDVGVDGYGAFGLAVGADATDATYDPVGAGIPAATTFQSGVAIRFGDSGGRTFLTSGDIGGTGGFINPIATGTATQATSSFSFGGLNFVLTQTLTALFSGLTQTGSLLTQSYAITNTGGAESAFELVRYLDGDLRFDGSLVDGGGRLISGATEFLFETDTADGTAASTTFVGITAEGGVIPVTNRYEVDSYSGLLGGIVSGVALDNLVTNDGGDADQFVDAGAGYDVTLALRNTFLLAAGGSTTYTTATYFGTGAPDEVTPPEVPEPASMVLFGLGGLGLMVARRRRQAA
jgi:hypothetical protein